ncbi:ISL3 family transposase (plasmid) [Aneurinibacillus sp. Ricciae_BoGa-3]|uniref:ISL3 family transposase n=1 Tax=Aneurinibacillus sp. Ricciae_BoGa-3 TaxID=3022697 RepID=UPI002341C110|nr:ISL3 family transposase [Aneurinibacillus sp. Ricciae_BoGa-3]WCK57653.1 ISL3 family transposase [Aneurinibacillus sp. Ricciae_BoGa-3]
MDILNLSNIQVTKIQENEHDYAISAVRPTPPLFCPECGFSDLKKFGKKQKLYMDLPIHAKRVGIFMEQQRFQCRSCQSTFREQYEDVMDERRFMTKRLVDFIEKQSLKRTFVSLSEELGVDEKTIRSIFREYVNRLEEQVRIETPQWLGIDEIHILSKARCVITNIEQRTLVDMLTNRNKETVIRYLHHLENKKRIRYVTMDMWNPYRDAVKEVLPQAKIIVDKFHVVRMANDCLETVRKQLRADLTQKQRRQLMHDRFVLLKRNHDLTEREILLLEVWSTQYPILQQVYDLKEGFYKVWDSESKTMAKVRLEEWKKGITSELKDAFLPLTKALKNWEDEIFAYFDHPITNAYTESLNSLIRVINRLGRGYSFEALRAKILLTEGVKKKTKPSYNRQAFVESRMLKMMEAPLFYNSISNYESPKDFGVDLEKLVQWIEEDKL